MKSILFILMILLAACSHTAKREPQSVEPNDGAKFSDCRLIVRSLDGKFLGMAPFEEIKMNEGHSYVATVRKYASARIMHNNGLETNFVYLDDSSTGAGRGWDRGYFAIRARNLSGPGSVLRVISDRSLEDFNPGVRWNEDSIVRWAIDSIGRLKGPVRYTGVSKRYPAEEYLESLEAGIFRLIDFENEWMAMAVCGSGT